MKDRGARLVDVFRGVNWNMKEPYVRVKPSLRVMMLVSRFIIAFCICSRMCRRFVATFVEVSKGCDVEYARYVRMSVVLFGF